METNGATERTVLVVDDDREVTDTCVVGLEGEYRVAVVHSGAAALDHLRDAPVDAVVLAERLPDRSGAETLVSIRDRGFDVRAILVTATRPSFDVLGVGFDAYLTKPVDVGGLRATADRLVASRTYDSLWGELSQLRVCRNVLRAEHPRSRLESDDHYRALLARIRSLESREAMYRASVDGTGESSAVRV